MAITLQTKSCLPRYKNYECLLEKKYIYNHNQYYTLICGVQDQTKSNCDVSKYLNCTMFNEQHYKCTVLLIVPLSHGVR